jgi:hypothetical protein
MGHQHKKRQHKPEVTKHQNAFPWEAIHPVSALTQTPFYKSIPVKYQIRRHLNIGVPAKTAI